MDYKQLSQRSSIREIKQNFLSNVPVADSHPNYFGMSSFLLVKFISNRLCNVVRRLEAFA